MVLQQGDANEFCPRGTTVELMNRTTIPTARIKSVLLSRQLRIGALASCVTIAATISSFPGATADSRPPAKSTWSIVKAVNNPRVVLFGVSCSSSTFCVSVGRAARGYSSAAIAVVRTSGRWSESLNQKVANWATELSAVSCPSSRWCAAVGSVTSDFFPTPLIEMWNGSRWRGLSDPYDYTLQGGLRGVSCPSPSECVAVGSRFIRRWTAGVAILDGQRWSFRTAAELGNAPNALDAVSCPSLHFCMAVGTQGTGRKSTTLAEEWDGAIWRVVPGPIISKTSTGARLLGVSCASSAFCMAAGVEDDSSAVSGIVERWNGRRWQLQSLGRGLHGASLQSISCFRTRSCVAVGYSNVGHGDLTLVEEWFGKAWGDRRNPVPDRPQNGLLTVTCIGPIWCMAAGGAGESAHGRAVLILRH